MPATPAPHTSPGGSLILRLPPAVLLRFPRGTPRDQAVDAAVERAMSDDVPDLDIEEGSDVEQEDDESEEDEDDESDNHLYMGETFSTPHEEWLANTGDSSARNRATGQFENSTSFDRMFDAGGIPYINPPPPYRPYAGVSE